MTDSLRDLLKERVGEFPTTPGVYLMKNKADQIIYVGKAKDLRARVRSYLRENADHNLKTQFLVNQIDRIDYLLTATEVEAFLLEASLIKKHRPRYNIRLKDDKAYPYIRASVKDDFPRLYLARRVKSDGAIYFGPYTSGYAVRETIGYLTKAFKIRDCKDAFMRSRKRPCMTYQIGRCTAPCVDLISKEDYGSDFDAVLDFLKGKDKKVIRRLKDEMKKAAEQEHFERAAKIRDSIDAIKTILEKQAVVSQETDKDMDVVGIFGDHRGTMIETLHIRAGRVIGNRHHFFGRLNIESKEEDPRDWMTSFLNQFYLENKIPDEIILPMDLGNDIHKLLKAVFKERQGVQPSIGPAIGQQKKKLIEMAADNAQSHFQDVISRRDDRHKGLVEIQKRFGLPEVPLRIECYDISTFQGGQTVASQVVFEEGLPKSDDYRRYKLRTLQGETNDYAGMKEVLQRRFGHHEYDIPQLILVDGGKGQLNVAKEILKEVGMPEIPVAGLAKSRAKGTFSEDQIVETQERFFLPGRQNPVVFAQNSQAFQVLVNLRDEAHRFAITYHRLLRDKNTLSSELDEIPGLGEVKKKRLLKKFGSIEGIKSAKTEEIATLKGFNEILATRILLHLNPSV